MRRKSEPMEKLVPKIEPAEANPFPNALRIAALADERKGEDIRGYDVRGMTLICDALVICTANSEPQMKAIYNHVHEGMKEINVASLRKEGLVNGQWLVLDYGTVIFHLFRRDARAYYDLDGLWADAPQLDLGLDAE